MRIVTRGILATLAGAGLIVITLAGCATPASPLSTPTPSPSPSAIHAPVFASDEEALKAATDAYAAYLAMSDTILADGGANPERLRPFVDSAQFKVNVDSFVSFATKGLKTQGVSRFDTVSLQLYREVGAAAEIDLYLCSDIGETRLVDATGRDVTPPDRPARLPLEIGLETVGTSHRLVVTKSDSWLGNDFC
jgi:hypothetical protein